MNDQTIKNLKIIIQLKLLSVAFTAISTIATTVYLVEKI